MFASRFFKIVTASSLLLGLAATVGCRIDHPPSRSQRQEIRQEKLADVPLPILPQPAYDDAVQVIQFCGSPRSDTVMPVYSKYYNGPVRRLEYVGRRHVTLDFIPSNPRAELAYGEAPLGPSYGGGPVSPNTTWRFQAGRMEQEVMITSHRLEFYLPCAGQALKQDF